MKIIINESKYEAKELIELIEQNTSGPERLDKLKGELAEINKNPTLEPTKPTEPTKPETNELRKSNAESYITSGGGQCPSEEEVAAESVAYDNALAKYKEQLEAFRKSPAVTEYNEFIGNRNSLEKQIYFLELISNAEKTKKAIIFEPTDVDEHGGLKDETIKTLRQLNLPDNIIKLLDLEIRACNELSKLCDEFIENPFISKEVKGYISNCKAGLLDININSSSKLGYFNARIEALTIKGRKSEDLKFFLKKIVAKIAEIFTTIANHSKRIKNKEKKPTEKTIDEQYSRRHQSHSPLYGPFKKIYTDLREKIEFEKLIIKAQKLFVEKFKENLADRSMVDEAVAHRKFGGLELSLSGMEAKGYFDKNGDINDDVKNNVENNVKSDYGRLEEAKQLFGFGNEVSDKEAIILNAINFKICTDIANEMKKDIGALVIATSTSTNPSEMDSLFKMIESLKEISGYPDTVTPELKEYIKSALEEIRESAQEDNENKISPKF